MSSPRPVDDSPTSSPLQRLAIVAGTLIIIVLTILAAIVLALRDVGPGEATPTTLAVVNPTPSPTAIPTDSPAVTISPATDIPLPTPTVAPPTSTPSATSTPTPLPPTETPTQVFTPTPVVIIVTPTPPPVSAPPVTAPPPAGGPPSGSGTVCQPPPGWVPYVVQLGDTLNSLSLRTDTSVYELQQVNCLEIFTLQIGQTIYLPFIPPTPTVTNTSTPRTPTSTPSRTGTPTATPRPPEIFSNFPDSGLPTEEITIAVQGRYFQPDEEGFRAELRTGGSRVSLELGDLRTTTSFEAIIPMGLPVAVYDLWVVNPDDQFDIRSAAYTVLSPP